VSFLAELTLGGMPLTLIWELFGFALLAAMFAGLVAPLVGCFLLVRRTGFYGVTLPQFAAAGIAFGFAIQPWWEAHFGRFLHPVEMGDDAHLALSYHMQWAGLFTLGGLFAMALATRKKSGNETSIMAAAFALASALTILFAQASAQGDIFVTDLLKGEILTIDDHELGVLVGTLGLVAVLLLAFRRELTQVGYDTELARVLGRRPLLWEALLMLLVGATVSAAVMTVGPILLFGLLVIPPLAARAFAGSMGQFLWLSSLAGLLSAAGGIWTSFHFDWPLGPSLVAFAALLLIPAAFGKRL